VINVVDPNMILLNEHGITKKNKVNIDGYITFSKNRNSKIMGGVSISTKKTEAQHVVKVKEGENDDEFILVRMRNINLQLMFYQSMVNKKIEHRKLLLQRNGEEF
jgi:hypothetical protein